MARRPSEFFERREHEIDLPHAITAFMHNGLLIYKRPADVALAADRRRGEINKLPSVVFRGRRLKQIRCSQCGSVRNVYASRLWHVVSLDRFRCAWGATKG